MNEKKYGYHEIRRMGFNELRNLCINQNWFTKGENKEYMELLNKADAENITTDDIVEMATMISEYSERPDGYTMQDQFESICFELFRICTTLIAED